MKKLTLLFSAVLLSAATFAQTHSYTYVFTNASFASRVAAEDAPVSQSDGAVADPATIGWTCIKDGNYTAGVGAGATTSKSGASAVTTTNFSNVSEIEIAYCTNKSTGEGDISVKIGDDEVINQHVKYDKNVSDDGRVPQIKKQTIDPAKSGQITITFTTTANSIYLYSIKITSETELVLPVVLPTNVALSLDTLELGIGKSQTLSAVVTPTDANNRSVTWRSTNEDVATVVDGKVVALAAGETYVIASCVADAEVVDTCVVKVHELTTYRYKRIELSEIKETDIVLITMQKGDNVYMLTQTPKEGKTLTNDAPVAALAPMQNDMIISKDDAIFWNIAKTDDKLLITVADNPDLTLLTNNNNNGVRIKKPSATETHLWTVADNGYLSINLGDTIVRYLGVYENNGTADWRAYSMTDKGAFPPNIKNQFLSFFVQIDPTLPYIQAAELVELDRAEVDTMLDVAATGELTLEVLAGNLTEDIALSLKQEESVFSLDKTELPKEGGELTISFETHEAGTYTNNIVLSSGSVTEEISVIVVVVDKEQPSSALDAINAEDVVAIKKIENGQVIIIRNSQKFNVQGKMIE